MYYFSHPDPDTYKLAVGLKNAHTLISVYLIVLSLVPLYSCSPGHGHPWFADIYLFVQQDYLHHILPTLISFSPKGFYFPQK